MIQVDYSLLLQIINFLLLIFILNILLYKPMLSIIDKRNRHLQEGQEEINRLKLTVEEKMAAYEEKVRVTKTDANRKNMEIIKEAADQAKIIVGNANKEISEMTEEYRSVVQKELQSAREYMSNQSRVLSVEIAEKVMGRRLQ